MIIIFTGDGKGKTTAALGQMLRVVGRNKNALMIQFIKGPIKSGEDYFNDAFSNLEIDNLGKFKIIKKGLGFVGILGDNLPPEKHKQAAIEAFELFKKELQKDKWHLIILDEINVALSLNLLAKENVMEVISRFPKDKILILTGRNAPEDLINLADLVTEMKEIKHPFAWGREAEITVEL